MANATEEGGEVQIYRQHGRFYENEFPEVDETVVVQVLKIDDKIGAYVSLLEYDGKEGMINLGELSKKRIRSLAKILRIGTIEVVSVMSVDEEKGYINLSKKRVEPEDAPPKLEQYAKAKGVHGIMQHVSKNNGIEVEALCRTVAWPLYDKHKSAFDAFKKNIEDDLDIWSAIDFSEMQDKADKIKEEIETHMRRRLIASTLRLQAKCDVSCSEYQGIDAIKEALNEGFKASRPKEECEVSIKLIAHPTFALTCQCKDKELGVTVLNEALEYVKAAIKERKGDFSVVSLPQIHKKEEQKGESDEEDSDEDKEDGDSDEASDMGDLDADALKQLDAVKVDED